MIRCRDVIGVLRHEGKASLAAATADLNSWFVVSGTWETTSCVAYENQEADQKVQRQKFNIRDRFQMMLLKPLTGFRTSIDPDDCESTKLPPIKFGTLWKSRKDSWNILIKERMQKRIKRWNSVHPFFTTLCKLADSNYIISSHIHWSYITRSLKSWISGKNNEKFQSLYFLLHFSTVN